MPSNAPLSIPDLADKAVLVTGASTGIGAALVRAYAAQDSKVGLHYNASREAAEQLAEEIRGSGGDVFLTQGDFSVSADVTRVVEETAQHFGRLDGLVNNAGGMLGRVPYSEMTDEQYDRVMDLNGRSVITACRVAIPWLKKQGGFIINTSSIAARTGAGNGAGVYGSAKAFVSNVTRGLAKELIGFGIRVNAVSPGVILTPFHERYSTPEQIRAAVAMIPQGRAGTAEDCVGAYLFLSSDLLSGYITGQVIEVNGGQLMP
ncbi:SDR family NAD(P)-dependent oxidoreductase [Mesorhizobium sp. BAC0120]|uniref:SDR family NAD(P)-dependent oxidoreductase n=1 Tax=Mesorhizobium sp. BAC0120 TaxID=3090670 RepID=UPI00298BE8F4|nr:SDR family NAD(P)-dependent oxidoreductase [Mesorhizobium sp. BAC0120]MDW6022255.1 SDR family NAD(P)-dependent oxidoreductase [Mesorhizobium sp. BAC0120]